MFVPLLLDAFCQCEKIKEKICDDDFVKNWFWLDKNYTKVTLL